MNRPGRSISSLIIAGISILLVGGALITTLAQSGFSPEISPTNTVIQIGTAAEQTAQGTATFTQTTAPTSTGEETQQPVPTQTTPTPSSTMFASETAQNSETETQAAVCEPPSDWIKYTIKSGDTLYSIATLFQTTYQTLQKGNCMWSSQIYPGETLYVPDNATITPTATPTKAPTKTQAPTQTFTNTPTPSITTVPTATFTYTPTPTGTATFTPTPTQTSTSTPTATATPTP